METDQPADINSIPAMAKAKPSHILAFGRSPRRTSSREVIRTGEEGKEKADGIGALFVLGPFNYCNRKDYEKACLS